MSDKVEACYDWKGNITQYRRESTWIPVAPGNRDYQELMESVAAGKCTITDPQFATATPTSSADGKVTGYLCEHCFVPIQPGNAVYEILKQQIADGTCLITAPSVPVPMTPATQIEEYQVAIVFERRWPELDGELIGEIPWVFGDDGKVRKFSFSIFNLKSEPQTVDQLLTMRLTGSPPLFDFGLSLSAAVIVVKISVSHLRYVLKYCLKGCDGDLRRMLDDRIAQDLWQTGRKKTDAPSIQFLIRDVNLYIHDFVSDLSNRIVEGYWLEYGGLPVGFLSTRDARNTHRIFARTSDGNVRVDRVQSFGFRGPRTTAVWSASVGLAAVSFGTEDSMPKVQRAVSRVSMMVASGLSMEALVLLNSVLEVSVLEMLLAAVRGNVFLHDRVKRAGHRARLEVLSAMAERQLQGLPPGFAETISAATRIYDHRNDYVHDLQLPAQKSVLDGKERSDLLVMLDRFLEPHQQQLWFNAISVVASGGDEIVDTIAELLPRKRPLFASLWNAVRACFSSIRKSCTTVVKNLRRS